MNKFLSYVSILLALGWAIDHFWYHKGTTAHFLLVAAIVVAFIRLLRGGTIVIK